MAKKEDMTKKTDQELTAVAAGTRKALREARFAAAGARPKDSDAPKKLRRTIARALTEARARRA